MTGGGGIFPANTPMFKCFPILLMLLRNLKEHGNRGEGTRYSFFKFFYLCLLLGELSDIQENSSQRCNRAEGRAPPTFTHPRFDLPTPSQSVQSSFLSIKAISRESFWLCDVFLNILSKINVIILHNKKIFGDHTHL